jgi:hypothetical protein
MRAALRKGHPLIVDDEDAGGHVAMYPRRLFWLSEKPGIPAPPNIMPCAGRPGRHADRHPQSGVPCITGGFRAAPRRSRGHALTVLSFSLANQV